MERVDVVIPALNEEGAVGHVVAAIGRPPVHTVWVVDNGSTDGTARIARAAGARVLHEPRRGYGSACLRALRELPAEVSVVVFLDADGSDDPRLIPALLRQLELGAELVVGSRAASARAQLTLQQRVGNELASRWLRGRFGLPATDLGPFRAIRRDALDALGMTDSGYGWTVEMQIKAARRGLRYAEIEVPVLPRAAGKSKVSGTVRGVLGASVKILGLLARHDLGPRLRAAARRLGRSV